MVNISIIIPTYNRAQDLDRCLNSLCEQTYKSFEVIVCDDGSNDHTARIVSSYESKLQLVYHFSENWGGPAVPRNLGIRYSKAPWICFLDSDDWWFPNKLSNCIEFMSDHDFIFHDVEDYAGSTLIEKKIFPKIFEYLKFASPKDILWDGNFIPCSSVCVRKELAEGSFFPEDKDIIALEDYFAWLRLFQKKDIRIKHVRMALSAYSINVDNISAYNRKYLDRLFSLKKKIRQDLNLDTGKSCLNYVIGVNLLHLDELEKARKFFMYSFMNSSSLSIKIKSLFRFFYG